MKDEEGVMGEDWHLLFQKPTVWNSGITVVIDHAAWRRANRDDPRWTQLARPLREFFAPVEGLLFDTGDLLRELGQELSRERAWEPDRRLS